MYHSFFKMVWVTFFLLGTSFHVQAGTVTNAKVVGVFCGNFPNNNPFVSDKEFCAIYFDQGLSSPASCVETDYNMRMIVNASGDLSAQILETARLSLKESYSVSALGSGTCATHPDSENLQLLFIPPSCAATSNTPGCIN